MNKLSTIMTTNVIVVKRQTPISEVIEILLKNNITGLPVVDDDMTLVGIISEKDVLSLISVPEDDSATTIKQYTRISGRFSGIRMVPSIRL